MSWVGSGSGNSYGVLVSGKGKLAVAGYSQVQWEDNAIEHDITEVNVRFSLSTARRHMWRADVQLQSF